MVLVVLFCIGILRILQWREFTGSRIFKGGQARRSGFQRQSLVGGQRDKVPQTFKRSEKLVYSF